MTYIRMTGGRDRGHVKDMPFVDAEIMLKNGQALPVNFDEADPLGFRELPERPELLRAAVAVEDYMGQSRTVVPGKPLSEVLPAGDAPKPPPASPAPVPVAPRKPAGVFKRGSR